MHPPIEMIDGHVGPDVPYLLLARAPDLLQIVEVLFDRGPVGEGFDNLRDRDIRIGREEGKPIVLFFLPLAWTAWWGSRR